MSIGVIAAEFIGGGTDRIFVLARYPGSFDGRCALLCPPFAEEMNKARKMVTELAQRLVAAGVAVVVPDLFGTGDSEGDFSDATWTRWVEDLHAVERWIIGKGWSVDTLLGIRLGCILAAQYARARESAARRSIFWQPVTDGARALEQFLRIRVAASLMRDEKETAASLKEQFAGGKVVEVAGYGLSPQLARELESHRLLNIISGNLGELYWFEVLRAADAQVSVAVTRAVEQLRQHGITVSLSTVVGEPFWASAETVWLPQLVFETVNAVCGNLTHG